MHNLHQYIFLNRTDHALDILTKWYNKKPDNKELQDLIKSVQYIVEHTNMVEIERQLYRDSYRQLQDRCIELELENKELWQTKK